MDRKNLLTRIVLITAAVTVAALGIAVLVGLGTSGFRWNRIGRSGITVDERKSLSLDGVDLVTVESVSEDVHLIEGTGASLDAWLHGTAGASSEEALLRLVVERDGSRAIVRVERTRPLSLGFFWGNVSLDVSVPRGFTKKMAVSAVSADISVADHAYAGLSLGTTSGDVRVETVSAADFGMHTTSGDFTAAAVTAQASDISSVSGDVRVKSLTGNATLHSTSGNLTVAFPAVPGRVEASSTSGDVALRFPADAGFQLDARSTSGDIRCQYPITIVTTSTGGGRHALAGTVGKGTGQVAIHTVSGDIRIED